MTSEIENSTWVLSYVLSSFKYLFSLCSGMSLLENFESISYVAVLLFSSFFFFLLVKLVA